MISFYQTKVAPYSKGHMQKQNRNRENQFHSTSKIFHNRSKPSGFSWLLLIILLLHQYSLLYFIHSKRPYDPRVCNFFQTTVVIFPFQKNDFDKEHTANKNHLKLNFHRQQRKQNKKGGNTCRVRALVCFVTKKLVRLTKYAKEELNSRYQTILISSLARARVIPTTSSSMMSVAGSRNTTAIGAMYMRRFIEFSFSLKNDRTFAELIILQTTNIYSKETYAGSNYPKKCRTL